MATPGYRFRYAHTLFRTSCRPRPPKGESDRPETRSAGVQRGTPRPVLPWTAAQLTAKVPNQNAFSSPGRVFDVYQVDESTAGMHPYAHYSAPLAFVRVANSRHPYDDTKRSATHPRVYLLRRSERVYQSCSFEISVLFIARDTSR
jgi:hypothetical protein